MNKVQRILLERPHLVHDHFYLATSITYPNQIVEKISWNHGIFWQVHRL